MAFTSPDDVFRVHPKIRWSAWVSREGQVRFCQMRPGVVSHCPEEEDFRFAEFNPLLLIGAGERMAQWDGRVESVTVTYEKVLMYVHEFKDGILALTVDRENGGADAIREISKTLKAMTKTDR
jgi:hypothetical protein